MTLRVQGTPANNRINLTERVDYKLCLLVHWILTARLNCCIPHFILYAWTSDSFISVITRSRIMSADCLMRYMSVTSSDICIDVSTDKYVCPTKPFLKLVCWSQLCNDYFQVYVNIMLCFWTRKRVPNGYQRCCCCCCCCWGSCCYQIFEVLKLFCFSTDRN